MEVSAGDVDLLRLLAQLLRAVSPEAEQADGGTAPGRAGMGAEPPAPPPVSGSEARALLELVAARGIAQGELGALLGLEKSTVSRLAVGLERKGWVKRGRDEANQRYIRLYLTPEGSEVAARVWRTWQSRQARILAGLSAGERAGLATGLRGLIRGLATEGLAAGRENGVAGPADPAGGPGPGVSHGAGRP